MGCEDEPGSDRGRLKSGKLCLAMCGRIIQKSGPSALSISDSRMGNIPPRYNAAPSQELLVIRQNHKTGERSLDLIKWGLTPLLVQRPERWPQAHQRQGRERLKAADVQGCLCSATLHRAGRCFFEWRAIKGARAKQPYAIAMKDGSPFGLAGLWENWRNPNTGEWERTFAIITVPSNELVGQIHDRMPAILQPRGYDRRLGLEPDPRDLLITYLSR